MKCLRCSKCCEGTLMELSVADLERLERVGHRKEAFADKGDDGIWRLRNVDGHCVFLEPKSRKCMVYSIRPLGCYIYPVNLGPDDALIVDALCPASDSMEPAEKRRKGALLRRHLREIDSQAKKR